MSEPNFPAISGTNYAFVNTLVAMSREHDGAPQVGDILDLRESELVFREKCPEILHDTATVVAKNKETLTLHIEGEGTFEILRGRDLVIARTKKVEEMLNEHQRCSTPEGVLFSDSCIPKNLLTSLRSRVQRLAENEPVDYHPGSGTRVRDLVHPSLYPYIEGRSSATAPLPVHPTPSHDRFGRPFEGSRYQWLPTPFQISDEGAVTIASYINNLDREKYGELYDDLGALFRAALPMIEGVLGYVDTVKFWKENSDFPSENRLPDPTNFEAQVISPRSVRGRELQVIPKIVDYDLQAGDTHEGVWHVEGMSHEHIVATCVTILDRSNRLDGGELSFKRPYTIEEAGRLFWHVAQCRPRSIEMLVNEATIPLGTVATPAGRVLVFPNSHIHKLNKLRVTTPKGRGRRRVIVFWIVDPDQHIPSTREVPPQQDVLSHEDALAARLALMEERRLHKTSFNPRVVSLCEH